MCVRTTSPGVFGIKELLIRNSYNMLTSNTFNYELLITNSECEALVHWE